MIMTFCLSSFDDPAYSHIRINALDDPSNNYTESAVYSIPMQNRDKQITQSRFYRFTIAYETFMVSGKMTAYSKRHALCVLQKFLKDKAKITNVPADIKITISATNVEYYIMDTSIIIPDEGDTQ